MSTSSGDSHDLESPGRAKGSTFELIALCKEVKFGTRQVENMLILYQSVFLPRLIYNCEPWSNMTPKDYKVFNLHSYFICGMSWRFQGLLLLLHCS